MVVKNFIDLLSYQILFVTANAAVFLNGNFSSSSGVKLMTPIGMAFLPSVTFSFEGTIPPSVTFYMTEYAPLFITRLVCYNTANTDGTIAYEYKECREAWSAGPGTLL